MTSTILETMKQALTELCNQRDAHYTLGATIPDQLKDAITNLKAAIKAMEDAEPVAWWSRDQVCDWDFVSGKDDPNSKLNGTWYPLYTAPAVPDR